MLKEGDIVMVNRNLESSAIQAGHGQYIGEVGVIEHILKGEEWPNRVALSNDQKRYFADKELTKIPTLY